MAANKWLVFIPKSCWFESVTWAVPADHWWSIPGLYTARCSSDVCETAKSVCVWSERCTKYQRPRGSLHINVDKPCLDPNWITRYKCSMVCLWNCNPEWWAGSLICTTTEDLARVSILFRSPISKLKLLVTILSHLWGVGGGRTLKSIKMDFSPWLSNTILSRVEVGCVLHSRYCESGFVVISVSIFALLDQSGDACLAERARTLPTCVQTEVCFVPTGWWSGAPVCGLYPEGESQVLPGCRGAGQPPVLPGAHVWGKGRQNNLECPPHVLLSWDAAQFWAVEASAFSTLERSEPDERMHSLWRELHGNQTSNSFLSRSGKSQIKPRCTKKQLSVLSEPHKDPPSSLDELSFHTLAAAAARGPSHQMTTPWNYAPRCFWWIVSQQRPLALNFPALFISWAARLFLQC